MKHYEAKLKDMLGVIVKGYGIGLIISIIFSFIATDQTFIATVLMSLYINLPLGSIISVILLSSSDTKQGLTSSITGFSKSLIKSALSYSIGSTIGFIYFLIKLFFMGIIALFLMLFALVSFPLNIIYTVVMYFVEKSKGDNGIDPSIADRLDKLVPALAVVLIVVFTIILI